MYHVLTRMNEKEFERVLKALANKRRLAILRFLKKKKEAPVGDVASAINLSFRATSRHLIILLAADILDREQRSVEMYYRIARASPIVSQRVMALL